MPAETAQSEGRRHYYDGKMHAVLTATLPPDCLRGGRVNCGKVAERIDCARYTVSKWLIGDRISPAGAKALIKLSGGRLTQEAMLPFLFN